MNKKIAVHVTNEEQWNEVGKVYGTDISPEFRDFNRYASGPADDLVRYDDGDWGTIEGLTEDSDEYELLEFNEWQARVKGDNMVEKIEVPQAVYDEFNQIVWKTHWKTLLQITDELYERPEKYPNLDHYLCDGDSVENDKINQLNLAKVIAGKAEFVPVEEKYYWQDKQKSWLCYGNSGWITTLLSKDMAVKLTETEIREKTSFDIDKLKKVSE